MLLLKKSAVNSSFTVMNCADVRRAVVKAQAARGLLQDRRMSRRVTPQKTQLECHCRYSRKSNTNYVSIDHHTSRDTAWH